MLLLFFIGIIIIFAYNVINTHKSKGKILKLYLLLMFSVAVFSYYIISRTHLKEKITIKCYYEYLPEVIMKRFYDEYGIEVICDEQDDSSLFHLLMHNMHYDIVNCAMHPNPLARFLFQLDLIHPLPESMHSIIPYNTPKELISCNGNLIAMPWMFGTVNLVYNEEKIKKVLGEIPENPLDLVFDINTVQKLYKARISITVLDSPFDVIYTYMIYKDLDIKKYDDRDLMRALKKLTQLSKFYNFSVLWYVSELQNGTTDIVLGWNDLLNNGIQGKDCYKMHIPRHPLVWIDGFVIPKTESKTSADYKRAELFLEFLVRPDNLADLISFRKLNVPMTPNMQYESSCSLDRYFELCRFWLGMKNIFSS